MFSKVRQLPLCAQPGVMTLQNAQGFSKFTVFNDIDVVQNCCLLQELHSDDDVDTDDERLQTDVN